MLSKWIDPLGLNAECMLHFIDPRTTSGFSHEWEQIEWNSNSRFDYNNNNKCHMHGTVQWNTQANFDSTLIERGTLWKCEKIHTEFFSYTSYERPKYMIHGVHFRWDTSFFLPDALLLRMRWSFHLLTIHVLCEFLVADHSKRIMEIIIIVVVVCSLNAHEHESKLIW